MRVNEIDQKYQAPALVRRLLESRSIAVVGLSAKPSRPSHGVGAYLLKAGVRDGTAGFIIAVATSFYVFLKYAKLWEHRSVRSSEDRRA